MKCPRCQAENDAGASFCEDCGARLEAACPSCGTPVTSGKKFCRSCGTALTTEPADRFASPESYTPKHLAEKILTSKAALEGERKQVTVLFVDVSGFTSLSERLDPEDVHGMMTRAFELMLAEVHRYEGTVNQFLGDGIMALFGAPIAHEDHARRGGARGARDPEALEAYADELRRRRGITFRVRQGLNTGLVVVGSIGSDLRMDYTAVGDTTNVAARLQQAAEPGHVLVSEATHRLVAGYFDMRSLGELSLKGKAEPVRAWDVMSAPGAADAARGRGGAGLHAPRRARARARGSSRTPSSGRRRAMGRSCSSSASRGSASPASCYEFRRRVGDRATWLEGHCLSFGQRHRLPSVDRSPQAQRSGSRRGTPRRAIVEKIDAGVLRLGEDLRPIVPYLRYLLSVDPGDPAVSSMDPRLRRGEIFDGARAAHRAGRPAPPPDRRLRGPPLDRQGYRRVPRRHDGRRARPCGCSSCSPTGPATAIPSANGPIRRGSPRRPCSAEDSVRMAEGVLAARALPEEIVDILVAQGRGQPVLRRGGDQVAAGVRRRSPDRRAATCWPGGSTRSSSPTRSRT